MCENMPDRRQVLQMGGALALSCLVGGWSAGCGPSGGSSGGTVVTGGGGGSGGGGGGTTTTTVTAALASRYGNINTSSTTHGNKIIAVGNVSGENIVYSVNNQRDDTTRPENKTVQTGDVIDVFDLINGSRLSFVV